MDFLIAQLIEFLTEVLSMSDIGQILTSVSAFGLLVFVFGLPTLLMRRRVRASVIEYDNLNSRLNVAQSEASKVGKELEAAKKRLPEVFLINHQREIEFNNVDRAAALAAEFIDQQAEALDAAFRTRMREAVAWSIEDGPSAFERARDWAWASLALNPQDRELRMLIDDFTDAQSVENTPRTIVDLRQEADRRARLQQYDRAEEHIETLYNLIKRASEEGKYKLGLLLAEHGVYLTSKPPFGKTSRNHLTMRRNKVEALGANLKYEEALSEIEKLLPEVLKVFGPTSSEAFYSRHVHVECLKNNKQNQKALELVNRLLPERAAEQGKENILVLATRYLRAQCLKDAGHVQEALKEANDLLVVEQRVLGMDHSRVHLTNYLIAMCYHVQGNHAEALERLERLLPLEIKRQGKKHPLTLRTRHLIAANKNKIGRRSDAIKDLEELVIDMEEVLEADHSETRLVSEMLSALRAI